jgi:hypothetical protein
MVFRRTRGTFSVRKLVGESVWCSKKDVGDPVRDLRMIFKDNWAGGLGQVIEIFQDCVSLAMKWS